MIHTSLMWLWIVSMKFQDIFLGASLPAIIDFKSWLEESLDQWRIVKIQDSFPAFKRKERNNYAGNLGDEIIRLWIVSQHWRLDSWRSRVNPGAGGESFSFYYASHRSLTAGIKVLWILCVNLTDASKKKERLCVNTITRSFEITAFNIAYWHRKYHSGTICKGVSNPETSNALSGCEKEEMWKWVWRRYRQRIRMKPKKSLRKMKGKNGILLFVEFLKGLLEDRKWR